MTTARKNSGWNQPLKPGKYTAADGKGGTVAFQIPPNIVRPLRDVVIVRIEPEPEKIGSIFIPDVARDIMEQEGSMVRFSKKPTHEGVVLAAGPGKWMEEAEYLRPMSVKPGDKILFGKFADYDFDNGIVCLLEDDIIGIMD